MLNKHWVLKAQEGVWDERPGKIFSVRVCIAKLYYHPRAHFHYRMGAPMSCFTRLSLSLRSSQRDQVHIGHTVQDDTNIETKKLGTS